MKGSLAGREVPRSQSPHRHIAPCSLLAELEAPAAHQLPATSLDMVRQSAINDCVIKFALDHGGVLNGPSTHKSIMPSGAERDGRIESGQ